MGVETILDRAMPSYDVTRIEHRVIDGGPEELFGIALEVDFVEALRVSPVAGGLFALRAWIERAASLVLRRAPEPEPAEDSLRLCEMPRRGEWIALGEDRPGEIAFAAVGRFWSGETKWEEIDAAEFAEFSTPGMARIGCNLSFRDYGGGRTLVSYESRVQATDPTTRRAFMRYWRPVSPLIGVVLRSVLTLIAQTQRAQSERTA